MMHSSYVEEITGSDEELIQRLLTLANAHESDRFRLGKTFARRIKDVTLLSKLCNMNARFNALFVPACALGVCYHTVKHPAFKKVVV